MAVLMDPHSVTAIAVDLAKGTVLEKLRDKAIAPVWEVLRPLLYPWWDEALHEVRLRLGEAIEQARAEDAEFVDRLARTLERGEADALVTALLRSAAQATTEARMKMLSAAAAGVFVPDLNSEMRSRVARAVAQLEPSDISELAGLVKLSDRFRNRPRFLISSRRGRDGSRDSSFASLVAAGCLLVDEQEPAFSRVGGKAERSIQTLVTATGYAVVRALRAWRAMTGDGAVGAREDAESNGG